MGAVYFIVGMTIFWLIAISMANAWEKRLIWPYVPADSVPPDKVPPPNDHSTGVCTSAVDIGFSWLGTCADVTSKLYRIRYEFFLSPDCRVAAIVSNGTLASMKVQSTMLYTLLSDGRCAATFDHQNESETDLAGMIDQRLYTGISFENLLAEHVARIQSMTGTSVPFQQEDPLADLQRFRQRRIERLVSLGYASFVDPEKTRWHYGFKGSVVQAFRGYFGGLYRALVPAKSQARRA